MKKIYYLFLAVAVSLVSCDPMEDINAELAAEDNKLEVSTDYTLTADDYKALDLKYGNFSSVDDAKAKLPAFLTDKYPVWGKGSLVNVTYKLYAPKKTEKSLIRYTVTTEDYDANPDTEKFNNFSKDSHAFAFLATKYPNPADRTLVSLTYKFYSGSVETRNDGFLYTNNEWIKVQGLTDDEYKSTGESYGNFSNEDEAEEKIAVFLKDVFKYNPQKAGYIHPMMYKLYTTDVDDLDEDGKTDDKTVYSYVKYFIFDGMNWSAYSNVVTESLKFGHDGAKWVPDNTIKYTLTGADYASVGNGKYNNFDVRPGKAEETVESRLAKINTILKANYPSAAEGQKFVVVYNVYSGVAEVWQMAVILTGGEYVLQN